MSTPLIDLRSTHNSHRWFLPLETRHCVGPPGRKFMFGGMGIAAAIRAMEETCKRPVIWATAQYLSYARPGEVVDLDVSVPADGKSVSQARVVAHVEDREILTVGAALGSRPDGVSHQWTTAPSVPPPLDCPETGRWPGQEDGLHGQLEVRVASGPDGRGGTGVPSGDGRRVIWMRPRHGHPVDAAMLAVMADHVPSGIGGALGLDAGGNSLDNTIRYLDLAPTEWVLGEIAIIAAARGFAHGAIRLYTETGRLMATASQSLIIRVHEPPPETRDRT